jgi:hypothetical protein
MRSPCQSRSTRLFGPTEMFLSRDSSCYRARHSQQMGLAPPAQLGATSREADTLAALSRITASFSASSLASKTQTPSLSMNRISWISQLL